jgi:hypothetical protein
MPTKPKKFCNYRVERKVSPRGFTDVGWTNTLTKAKQLVRGDARKHGKAQYTIGAECRETRTCRFDGGRLVCRPFRNEDIG